MLLRLQLAVAMSLILCSGTASAQLTNWPARPATFLDGLVAFSSWFAELSLSVSFAATLILMGLIVFHKCALSDLGKATSNSSINAVLGLCFGNLVYIAILAISR